MQDDTIADHCLDSVRFQEHVETLTAEQREFVVLLRDWIRDQRHLLVVVSGGPGTGKTHAVVKTLDLVPPERQVRMAPTARIAQAIGGRTIHSRFRIDWTEGSVLKRLEKKLVDAEDTKACIEESDVLRREMSNLSPEIRIVVVDEVGMIPFWFAVQIVTQIIEGSVAPMFIVVMGDKHQLRPVASNENLFDIYNLFCDRLETHLIELNENKRFDEEYKNIVQRLCRYVDENDEDGMFSFMCETYPVVCDIDASVLKRCDKVLAFKNATVENYNRFYLKSMVEGPIVRLFRYSNDRVNKKIFSDVKAGCLVYATQNGPEVKNGTPLVFETYDPLRDYVKCRSVKNPECCPITMFRNKHGDFPLVVGFAGTVHKFQGDTINENKIAINFDGSRDLNLVYTALSRVKSLKQILAIQL